MTDGNKTILFVDDERSVLSSLRRLLRKEDWNLLFANSGAEGLEVLEAQHVDLVVSDVRMRGMDGVTFLKQVKGRYPRVARIILSGYAEKEMVTQALVEDTAHQMLTKPWDEEEFKGVLQRTLQQAEGQKQEGQWLQQIINSLPSLPTLPQIYLEVKEVLEDQANLSANRIAEVIERDPSISVRLLRWSNSALFGQMHRVDTVKRAVVVLGMEMVEGLVLSMSAFDTLSAEAPEIKGFNREAFWNHSIGCGAVAKLILEGISADKNTAERAFTAGLLHDLGKLLEDAYLHDQFEEAIGIAREKKRLLREAEQDVLRITHAETGAYLAEWWNLPPFFVNAIGWHHTPHLCDGDQEIVAAVHVADVLVQRFQIGASGNFSVPSVNAESWSRFRLSKGQLSSIRTTVELGIR